MGSKRRIAKDILPIILEGRYDGQWYVEPFVGGANIFEQVKGNRWGSDNNIYLIEALKLIRDNPESIPDLITEDDYIQAKNTRGVTGLTGFIGFAMSFGGKWFGGYRRDVAGTKGDIENMKTQTRRAKQSAIKQSKLLQGSILTFSDYINLPIPPEAIVYCDPPYEGTTKYKDKFDHELFWHWCRNKSKQGHRVFISEYNAPNDFECIWSKTIHNTLKDTGSKKGVEKLFVYKG